jgi:hypothetical protein
MLNPEQWRVTIIRVRPRLIGLAVFIVGLIVGLAWAYGVAPTIWQNAEPVHLHPSYQIEWVKLVADQYARTGDDAQAGRLLASVGDAVSLIDTIRAQAEQAGDRDYAALLNRLRGIALGVGADASNPVLQKVQYGGLQTMSPIVLILLVAIIGTIVIILVGMYGTMVSFIVKGLIPGRRKGADDAQISEASRLEVERRRAMQEARSQEAPVQQRDVDLGPPVAQFMSAYIMGDDYFDDSFSIEDAGGGFLGETGAGISETIGVGAPKKVTAVEVWLFDKNDIRTITKVVMSEHAYNDEALRAKLASKGDAVLAMPGQQIELETQTLRVIATIRDMSYGSGALPPNSFFERLTLDIAAYAKEGATSAPGSLRDMYDGTVPLS